MTDRQDLAEHVVSAREVQRGGGRECDVVEESRERPSMVLMDAELAKLGKSITEA